MHDFNDKDYWIDRWNNCTPYTYPPELYSMIIYMDVDTRNKILQYIFPKYTGPYTKSVCARCNERIGTGHMCEDLVNHRKIIDEK